MVERFAAFDNIDDWGMRKSDEGEYVRYSDHEAELSALKKQVEELTAERDEKAKCVDYAEKDFLKAIARAESAEAEAAALREAWEALAAATVSSIRENDNPNRVIFKDGFTIEGRAADEWLKFMRLIQRMARAAIDVFNKEK